MIAAGAPDNGFHEAVGIVQNLGATIERLCAAFGYSLLWRGSASRETLELLELDWRVSAEEALIGAPDQGRGYIRLLSFPGLETGVMRDGAQAWDAGGIFDINVYALSPIAPLHQSMTRVGFRALAPITAYDFSGLAVKEVLECDSDGLAIAIIERERSSLPSFDGVCGPVSYVFNSTQSPLDFQAAHNFYVESLGWAPVYESSWTHPGGYNCIGLPLDIARTRTLRVGIYQARGLNEGSVELLEVDGERLDFSAAAPPDRGWAALRFPMADIAAFIRKAALGGCRTLAPRTMIMEPYGVVEAAAAITPWGVRLEAYAALS